jgi:hypothetical protein
MINKIRLSINNINKLQNYYSNNNINISKNFSNPNKSAKKTKKNIKHKFIFYI